MSFFAFLTLTAYAVWNGADQRPGTLDELRTLAGVLAAILIFAGVSVLTTL